MFGVPLLYAALGPFAKAGVSASRVHGCDLRAIDAALVPVGAGETIHDILQRHHVAFLDLYFAIPYATYLVACFAFAVYMFFRDEAAMRRFTLGFLLLNATAFALYHIVPAAPPWYVHAHGCAIDMGATPSAGPSLLRVDAMLGVPYFAAFYARSTTVFGAMPSLHAAYPTLIFLVARRAVGRALKIALGGFAVSMFAAAIYLDHHWVVDVLAGIASACCVHFVVATPRERLARVIATWFGCGRFPRAPGTVGTLGAIPLYLLVRTGGPFAIASTAALLFAPAVWAAGRVASDTRLRDPQIVVVDGVVGVLVTLAAAPSSLHGLLFGVLLFRAFDIAKPWPVRRFDCLRGGYGIVLDGVAAGAMGAILLVILRATGLLA
jgi:phosphatidylglycerophosphatase A